VWVFCRNRKNLKTTDTLQHQDFGNIPRIKVLSHCCDLFTEKKALMTIEVLKMMFFTYSLNDNIQFIFAIMDFRVTFNGALENPLMTKTMALKLQ